MPWVRFDDQFPIHRKVKGLSDAAYRLHTEAIFWCARNLTDGFVPTDDVPELATARRPHKSIPELVSRGVWSERADGDGWQIHDYLEYQPSKAKVEREREAKAERQRRWLEKQKGKKETGRDASTPDRDASKDASQDGAPYPPRPDKGGGGNAPERASPTGHRPDGPADDAREKARARALAIANCHLCDHDGYRERTLCDHDPEALERAKRGRALVKAALQRKAQP